MRRITYLHGSAHFTIPLRVINSRKCDPSNQSTFPPLLILLPTSTPNICINQRKWWFNGGISCMTTKFWRSRYNLVWEGWMIKWNENVHRNAKFLLKLNLKFYFIYLLIFCPILSNPSILIPHLKHSLQTLSVDASFSDTVPIHTIGANSIK